MRKLGLLLILSAACARFDGATAGDSRPPLEGKLGLAVETPRPWEARPEAPPVPPPAPVHVMRGFPEFAFVDASTSRRYEIWEYQDETSYLPLVTVQEAGGLPRLAVWHEINFAFKELNRRFRHRDMEGKFRYLAGDEDRRWAISPQELDDAIHHKMAAVRKLEGAALTLEAHIRACSATKVQLETIPPTSLALADLYADLDRARRQLAILVDTKRALYELN